MAAALAARPSASSSCSCSLAAQEKPAAISPKSLHLRPRHHSTPCLRIRAQEDGRPGDSLVSGSNLTPADLRFKESSALRSAYKFRDSNSAIRIISFSFFSEPLTITDLPNSAEGSLLRVAYQVMDDDNIDLILVAKSPALF